jgi:ParB/RepB/Spo0J family partition protein
MKVQSVKLKTSVLFHAPWNPRGEITPESVADLTASIKERGLLQDIGVWRDETNAYFVIYGNRRFVACREAGMTEIPAKLYDCPHAVAQELTRIENEVRLGVDPLEDAKLLNSMRTLGFTQEELAAHFAVPLATVCRRLKLTDLVSELLELVKSQKCSITTDALERLSAYPADIQRAIAKHIEKNSYLDRWTWGNLKHRVAEHTRDLDQRHFPQCVACLKRTGAALDLFDELPGGESLGCCLDKKCYKALANADILERLNKIVPASVKERVKLQSEWDFNYKKISAAKPSKANPCAYYVVDRYSDKIKVKYGPSEKERKAKLEAEKDRREIERAKVEREREEKIKRLDSINEKFQAWAKDNIDAAFKACLKDEPLKIVDFIYTFELETYGEQKALKAWRECRSTDRFCDLFLHWLTDNYKTERPNFDELAKLMRFLLDVDWEAILGSADYEYIILEEYES